MYKLLDQYTPSAAQKPWRADGKERSDISNVQNKECLNFTLTAQQSIQQRASRVNSTSRAYAIAEYIVLNKRSALDNIFFYVLFLPLQISHSFLFAVLLLKPAGLLVTGADAGKKKTWAVAKIETYPIKRNQT